ncbi:MAG: hypothetical protein J5779_02310 [Clostridia bacterium]|nr:hypothetical protein [Clostridia bacterium]
MQKTKNYILTSLFAFAMIFCVMFGFAGCFDEKFECADKTFVYDKCEITTEVTSQQKEIIKGMALAAYENAYYKFNADGSYVYKKNETTEGTYEIAHKTLVLTTEGNQKVLNISGKKFYVVEQVGDFEVRIYFKIA